MTDTQQRAAAKAFAKNWKDRGYEKGDSQIFWVELLTTVFGVTEISQLFLLKISCLHLGQYRGKFMSIVSPLIFKRVLLRHTGHNTH